MKGADPGCLAAALDYLARGWSVIPICDPAHKCRHEGGVRHPPQKKGKVPLVETWEEFQHVRASAALVEGWFKRWPAANVAVVMGRISGVVRFDCDSAADRVALETANGAPFPPTLVFSSGRGTGYLFAWDPAYPLPPSHSAFPGTSISYIGEGGYSVMPPSRHKDGGIYRWQAGPGKVELAPIPIGLIGCLVRHHEKRKAPGKKTRVGGGAVPPVEDPALLGRARDWVKGFERSVEGKNGHRIVFALACSLVHGFKLPDPVAVDLMDEFWSPRCEPPWDREEIAREVAGARERGAFGEIPHKKGRMRSNEPGAKEGAQVPQGERPAASDGPVADEGGDNPRAGDGADDAAGDHADGEKRTTPLFRLANTLTPQPLRWLYEPWIQRGKLSAVAGMPGTGKSTLGAWLCRHAGRALVFPGAEESAEDELYSRLNAAGCDLSTVAIADNGEWQFPADCKRLSRAIKAHNADLVWFDPLDGYVIGGNPNDALWVRPTLEALAAVARDTGAALVFVRHPGKQAGNIMPGSAQWMAVPRSVIELIADRTRPGVFIARPEKRSRGREAPATYYHLDGSEDEPRVWRWGEVADKGEVEELREEPDRLTRRGVAQARALLRGALAEGPMLSGALKRLATDQDIHPRTMQRAAEREGVEYHRRGSGTEHRCYWYLPGCGEPPPDDS